MFLRVLFVDANLAFFLIKKRKMKKVDIELFKKQNLTQKWNIDFNWE